MPQTPERKSAYAKERRAAKGDQLRAKGAEWASANRDYLQAKSMKRRLEKRAMCLVAAARIRARKKCIPFSLVETDIQKLQSAIDSGFCELSGIAFTLAGARSASSPSLDRIIPALGYVAGNVRVICHAMNAALGDWGEEQAFLVMSAFVAQRSSGLAHD